jgi:hypothetical protein
VPGRGIEQSGEDFTFLSSQLIGRAAAQQFRQRPRDQIVAGVDRFDLISASVAVDVVEILGDLA